jgi:hypothetical protein
MNPDDLNALWHSPQNEPAPARLESDRQRFLTTLRQRDRGFRVCMALVFGWLTVVTGRLVWVVVSPTPGRQPIDFTREWAVLLFLALPWLGAILLVRQHRHRSAWHPAAEPSISDSLRALVGQCRGATARVRTLLWLHVLGVPLLAVCLRQIIHAGKAQPHEIPSMIAFFACVVALSMGGLACELWRQRRETRRLERLLQDYEETEGTNGD